MSECDDNSKSRDVHPIIRISTQADRDVVLAFVAGMGFNPRDAVTWDALNMSAMTAWFGDRLVGAISFEPRRLRISASQTIDVLHETVVAVDPEHRSGGLGTRLQQAIFAQAPPGTKLITVFREDPASGAYRWYVKNGFVRAMQIETWAFDKPAMIAGGEIESWRAGAAAAPWREIEAAWAAQCRAGVVDRASRSLRDWLAVHPYRNRYDFQVIRDQRDGFALLGIGTMHSDRPRTDVLELMPLDETHAASESILRAAAVFAAQHEQALRVPVATGDPLHLMAAALGARPVWSFDLLARPLSNASLKAKQTACWRYAGVDFI